MFHRLISGLGVVAVAALISSPVLAQGYFVPQQQRPAAAAPRAPSRSAPQPAQLPPQADDQGPPPGMGQDQSDADAAAPNIPIPPVPDLVPLPQGTSPPAAVIGVIGVPEVMHASTAAQQIDRVISQRRQALAADAQKEQASWGDMQKALVAQRSTMSQAQVTAKEHDLQQRITDAQARFRTRNQVIQEAAQVALNQVQSALIAIIRQVSQSRGMNLVLHRAQVALNVNDFDITQQVTDQLNKLLPSVIIPADGVSPLNLPVQPVPILPSAIAQPGASTVSAPGSATPAPATPTKKP